MSTSWLEPIVAVAAMVVLWSSGLVDASGQLWSAVDEQQARAAVTRVRAAILSENVGVLLQNVSRVEGLTCTDTTYSHEEVGAFLRDKDSHLYMSLFDSSRFSTECGGGYPAPYPAISEKEFLRSAIDSVAIVRLDPDWVKVTLTSPVRSHYPRHWYFHRESGAWKLSSGSLIVGRCTCG